MKEDLREAVAQIVQEEACCNRPVGGCEIHCYPEHCPAQKAATRILALISSAKPGWVLVPCKPTRAMLNEAVDVTGAGSDMSWSNMSPQSLFDRAYRAMIAAAPAPPTDTKEG